MNPTVLFSWGYWGWGNATAQLVTAVDAVEKRRGFEQPLFVDVRFMRQVRAQGFAGAAFERVVGRDRYMWMRALGNRSVATRSGPAIQIADPKAADELLDLALASARRSQRVIFFCSCKHPLDQNAGDCHRVTVAKLVREAARVRALDLTIVEWPGGAAEAVDLEVSSANLRKLRGGRKSLPLDDDAELARFAGLPWGSIVRVHAEGVTLAVMSGPACFQGGRWCLPIFRVFTGDEMSGPELERRAHEFRRLHGYDVGVVQALP